MRSKLIFLFCLLSAGAFSQTDTTVNGLTFKEAVQLGLERNVILNQEKNNLVTASANRTAALFQMTPTIGISGNAGRNDGNSFNQQQGEVVNGKLDFLGASLNASMPLFNGLNNFNTYRSNENLNQAQGAFVKRTTQDVIRFVANQFLTCLLDQQLLAIQQKNLETQQQQYNQIKEQVAAGSRAEVDLFNQEYQVRNAELLVLRANFTLQNDKITLAQTIQLNPEIPFVVQEPLWDINQADQGVAPLSELQGLAKERRGDLARAQFVQKSAKLLFQSNKGIYFPGISLFAQYGSQYNYIHPTETFNPTNRTFNQQFLEDNTQLTYGLSFTIPLFTGFTTRSNVVRSRMQYENAKLQAEDVKITVTGDVLKAYQNYEGAKANFTACTAQLHAAEIAFNLEKERYLLGISDIVAQTLATQNYTKAQGDFASAKYTLMFQRILIDHAVGTLKFEDIP